MPLYYLKREPWQGSLFCFNIFDSFVFRNEKDALFNETVAPAQHF